MALVDEQVIDFFHALFTRVFSEPFGPLMPQRLKRNAVIRQVEESADAASQSLTRLFVNQQLTGVEVEQVLTGLEPFGDLLRAADVANPNIAPETVVEQMLPCVPCPASLESAGLGPVYRVALHSVVQVLMLVAPVMEEWRKVDFSSTYELPRRVVNRLNQISGQMDALAQSGQAAADERYELIYRDYLLQRFHRIEAGTVRMTTNLDVDLRELFVMPRIQTRERPEQAAGGKGAGAAGLMDLSAARRFFEAREDRRAHTADTTDGEASTKASTALDQVRRYPRNVIVGAPGTGKSTFFEWLQVKLASVEEVLELAGQQAIPLLLRVRQLEAQALPEGAALIAGATGSKDNSALMPPGWLDRQMKRGRVLFMLDGLDETEPDLRDRCVIPWLQSICQRYPHCRYLISSRPVGYPEGTLSKLEFAECDLLDFEEPQIAEYTRHWCAAVRLARNEPEKEARREGKTDGEQIVAQFGRNPYIRHLARNPLMLSAVCLVNYFEHGQLPDDRAVLYKLCVEGLLHNWDQRRGIHSTFGFEEKLRACRELAIAMQVNDRAEFEAERVHGIFSTVLGNAARAEQLLSHIRYRTGLLLERRPKVFAFAHLTFQEYLAAQAVHEGNRSGVDAERLVREHADGRWEEVLPLYCGVTTTKAAKDTIERLLEHPRSRKLSTILGDAYLSASRTAPEEDQLRRMVLEKIASGPECGMLGRFAVESAALVANSYVGRTDMEACVSEAFLFLARRLDVIDVAALLGRLKEWRKRTPHQNFELVYLLHRVAADSVLLEIASDAGLYDADGAGFPNEYYSPQGVVALMALADRRRQNVPISNAFTVALLAAIRAICGSPGGDQICTPYWARSVSEVFSGPLHVVDPTTKAELVLLARRFATWLEPSRTSLDKIDMVGTAIDALDAWASEASGQPSPRLDQIVDYHGE